jgi:hypothetical protein
MIVTKRRAKPDKHMLKLLVMAGMLRKKKH